MWSETCNNRGTKLKKIWSWSERVTRIIYNNEVHGNRNFSADAFFSRGNNNKGRNPLEWIMIIIMIGLEQKIVFQLF